VLISFISLYFCIFCFDTIGGNGNTIDQYNLRNGSEFGTLYTTSADLVSYAADDMLLFDSATEGIRGDKKCQSLHPTGQRRR
jgi:hypothetical protein